MSRDSRVTLRWTVLMVGAVALLAVGAGAAYFVLRPAGSATEADRRDVTASPPPASAPVTPAASVASNAPLPDVVVTLSQDGVDRAGIVVSPVGTSDAAGGLRLPGIVQPDAYRQVEVTPLVAGRITRVQAELGEQVRRGQTLAHIFSPELASAQTQYTAARAELEAHERELERTQKLMEIGAASRQELERIVAQHAAQTATVQSARARLELLGVSAAALDAPSGKDVGASATVPAPISGVVTERLANIGLNVDSASKLFTVTDLSSVWVVADLYEKNFSRVQVGSPAIVTTTAYPDLVLRGRVSYIDPEVRADTRTAKLRVEVPNPEGKLRLGMFADVQVTPASPATVPAVPRSAVQNVGDRDVVYLVNPREPGKFTEREVRLGATAGEEVEVLSGVQPGDVIVTEGSFFVRAERERLGLRASAPAPATTSAAMSEQGTGQAANVQATKVVVTEKGYEPAKVSLRAGIPARITFVRITDNTCGTEVVFPSLSIKRTLPLNEPVVVEFTPAKSGDIAFACGMNMLHGTVVVQ